MQSRYGTPVATAQVQGYIRCQYEKDSFLISVFYFGGRSVIEEFARRGLSQEDARKVVQLVAGQPLVNPSPAQETALRQAAGINNKEEVFWLWSSGPTAMNAAFNATECTLTFFHDPVFWARVQQVTASTPLAVSH